MNETRTQDIKQIYNEENAILIADFSKKEINEIVMQMEKNKAPESDEFAAEFYQRFWEVIKSDLMAMFDCFQRGELPLFHLNFGTIILLPKKENEIQIQQCRPYAY
jgi:hypothetical protein